MLVADARRGRQLVCPFPIVARSSLQYYFVCPVERRSEPSIVSPREWLLKEAGATVRDLSKWIGAVETI